MNNVKFSAGKDPSALLGMVHGLVVEAGHRLTARAVAEKLHDAGVIFEGANEEKDTKGKQLDRAESVVSALVSCCDPSFLNSTRGPQGGIGTGDMVQGKKTSDKIDRETMKAFKALIGTKSKAQELLRAIAAETIAAE